MATIEERAKAALYSYDWNIYYHYSELTEDSFKDGYIQGATEQKAIDIDKAKNAFCHKCFLKYDNCRKHCLAYKHFSEAMEEGV